VARKRSDDDKVYDMDLFSAIIGFITGMVLTMVAMEYMLYRSQRNVILRDWDLSSEENLRICATNVGDVPIPYDTRIVVRKGAKVPPEISRRALVKEAENVNMNFALSEDRAYIFMGSLMRGTPAILTTDESILEELDSIFKRFWEESERHIYELSESLESLEEFSGSLVRITGRLLNPELLRHGHEARLVLPNGRVISVVLSSDSRVDDVGILSLHGTFVEVEGVLRVSGDKIILEASSIRRT